MKLLMLLLAGIFEIAWAVAMKYSNGLNVFIPSIITIVTYFITSCNSKQKVRILDGSGSFLLI